MNWLIEAAGVLAVAVSVMAPTQERQGPQLPTAMLAVSVVGERADGERVSVSTASLAVNQGGPARAALDANPASCAGHPGVQDSTGQPTGRWEVQAVLQARADEYMTLDVRWTRRGPGAETPLRFARRVQLHKARPYVLDLLPVSSAGPNHCDRFSLELRFEETEPAATASARFRYELWLVRRQGERTHTEQLQFVGRQGSEIEYMFAPFGSGPAERPRAEAADVEISGTVRARARADADRIDVQLQIWRHIAAGAANAGEGGTKQLVVQSGETTEVVLPPPTRVPPGVEPDRFDGESTALRIRVTRLR
jgi:hypothetical protein